MRALDLVLSHLECISGSSTDNLDLAQSPRKVKYTDVQSLMASLLVVLASPSKVRLSSSLSPGCCPLCCRRLSVCLRTFL